MKVTGRKTIRSLNQTGADGANNDSPFEVAGDNDKIVVRTNQEASALPRQKFSNRLDFFRTGLLFGDHVVQAKNHHRVGVAKDLFT